MKLYQWVVTIPAALGLCASANADLIYTFNTDTEGFQAMNWTPGPAGWAGGAALQQSATAGGWTMGGGGPRKEFSWTPGGGVPVQQLEMRNLAASGNARFAFDLILDGSSFPVQAGTWYSINMAGNSGTGGWTQIEKLTGDAWHNAGDNTLLTYHFDFAFAQMGWVGANDWYQVFWGSNSDFDKPIGFYIDNVECYLVPEPGALSLVGLGALALLTFRRRR